LIEAFHIRRIRLVNFHNIVDETLAVRKNLFLIGDNQSGKTTILDAVHFALSAGVEMEFNAAARFGPRTEPGRNLGSIVLRYDLERDITLRGPSVMYAALEIASASGTTHTFGAGAFATSLESNPDVWGFVARGRPLEKVGLCIEQPDGSGVVRRRPRDRSELEGYLGRGAVLDKGRYRTAVAQLLFRDRDAYERALELLAAGKAYREMVARARNLDDSSSACCLHPRKRSSRRSVRRSEPSRASAPTLRTLTPSCRSWVRSSTSFRRHVAKPKRSRAMRTWVRNSIAARL
jgi:hypothetical protein